MKNLNRKTFWNVIDSPKLKKALELYLYAKNKYVSSTITNFTYKNLSKETGLCFTTLKKRISTLNEMGLIQFIGKNKQHLLFKKTKNKYSNIDISKLDLSDIDKIGDALVALFLVETQQRKEYIKHLFLSRKSPKNMKELRKAKREIRLRGYKQDTFNDNGISYKYIADKLKIGFNKVSDGIKYAEKNNMIVKEKRAECIQRFEEGANFAAQFIDFGKNVFFTSKGVFKVYANLYHIPNTIEC